MPEFLVGWLLGLQASEKCVNMLRGNDGLKLITLRNVWCMLYQTDVGRITDEVSTEPEIPQSPLWCSRPGFSRGFTVRFLFREFDRVLGIYEYNGAV